MGGMLVGCCVLGVCRDALGGWMTRFELYISDHARTFQNTGFSHLFMNAEVINCGRLVLTTILGSLIFLVIVKTVSSTT